jgi:hypothetical protein
MLARLAAAGLALASLRSVNESWPCGASDDSHLTPCYESDLTSAAEWQAWCGGATNAISYWLGPAPAVAADRPLTHWGIFCKDEWQLLWHLNALGTSAHSHQDVLHCSISHGGLAVMIDPGTGRSFPASALRDRLAGPTAHNGPHLLDLACYPQRLGNFGWSKGGSQPHRHGNSAAVRIRGHTLTRSISELERGWRFTDECTAPFAVHWQLAPGWEVEPHDDYLLLFRDGHSLRLQITGPACRIVNETCSPGYGQVIDAPMIMALAAAGGCVVTELTAERLL